MTNQEAFNVAVRHLLGQYEVALTATSGCSYRGRYGLMCPIGAMIPDAQYSAGFEGQKVHLIYNQVPALAGADVELLTRLQNVHDMYKPKDWVVQLLDVACDFKLDDSAVFDIMESELEGEVV